jgi:hypothetical protein
VRTRFQQTRRTGRWSEKNLKNQSRVHRSDTFALSSVRRGKINQSCDKLKCNYNFQRALLANAISFRNRRHCILIAKRNSPFLQCAINIAVAVMHSRWELAPPHKLILIASEFERAFVEFLASAHGRQKSLH